VRGTGAQTSELTSDHGYRVSRRRVGLRGAKRDGPQPVSPSGVLGEGCFVESTAWAARRVVVERDRLEDLRDVEEAHDLGEHRDLRRRGEQRTHVLVESGAAPAAVGTHTVICQSTGAEREVRSARCAA
jgi:hypothetical protein